MTASATWARGAVVASPQVDRSIRQLAPSPFPRGPPAVPGAASAAQCSHTQQREPLLHCILLPEMQSYVCCRAAQWKRQGRGETQRNATQQMVRSLTEIRGAARACPIRAQPPGPAPCEREEKRRRRGRAAERSDGPPRRSSSISYAHTPARCRRRGWVRGHMRVSCRAHGPPGPWQATPMAPKARPALCPPEKSTGAGGSSIGRAGCA